MKPQKNRSRSTSPSIRVPFEHIPLNSFQSSSTNRSSISSFFQRTINQIIEICYRIPLLEKLRYRYFTFFILILFCLTLFQGIFTILGSISLWESDQLVLEKQIYGPISYLGLDANIPDELPHGTTIYHVSKEFGPATLSSMGQIVTGLAQAQANNGSFDVNVIIPFYSYMRKLYKFQKFAQLELQVRDGHGKWQSVKFLVHRMLWNITNNELLEPRSVQVYVIGSPAGVFPLNLAFTTEDVTKIYSSPYSPYPLSQDWKDIYFCKAVAELITYLNTDIDTPLFALTESRGVDIVHLHGASNALVIEFMKSLYVGGKFKRLQPAIVYTIHDYIEEQLYSNAIVNVQKFIDLRNYTEVKSRYFNGRQMYTSAIAIDQAQIVTFVSKIIAQEMVEVPLDFYAKELIMPSILERAIKGEWIGITSGLDFTIINPFNDTLLRETNSNFPNNIYNFDAALLYAETIENSTQPLIITSKFNAKIHLIREGLLSGEDLNRTIVLFTGNFQYSKGLEFFQEATDLLVSRNAKFIIMGQNSNYPISSLKQLAKYYPDNVIIIDDVEFQTNWENLYKAAADILFVPSKSESSGLTAAEGLLFGCSIVGTEVGGLKEFLVNKTSMSMKGGYNSYLFNLIDEKNVELSINEMKTALNNSINDLIRLNSNLVEKEILIRNLVKDALRLGWDRPNGPLEKYIRVYRMALLKLRKGFDKIETLISI